MTRLAYFYGDGFEVPVSFELAYIYYGLATQGIGPGCHQCTKGNLDEFAKKMTARQLVGPQATVSVWHRGMPLPTAYGLAAMAHHAEKVMEKSFCPE